MRTLNAVLTCSTCGVTLTRLLRLPDEVEPPTTFTCASCTSGRSALDKMTTEQIAKAELPGAHEQRKAAVLKLRRNRATMWDRKNPIRARMRQFFRTDRHGKPPYAGMGAADRAAFFDEAYWQWTAKIEEARGRCPFCGLDMQMVCRRFVDADGPNLPVNWTPACRKCAAKRYFRVAA